MTREQGFSTAWHALSAKQDETLVFDNLYQYLDSYAPHKSEYAVKPHAMRCELYILTELLYSFS